MNTRTTVLIAALFALTFSVTASAGDILSELDAANRAFARAILAGDVDYLVNDYTDDGCVIAPSTPKTCGKDAIRELWKAVIASGPKNVEIITLAAGNEGPLAYATGDLLITDAESTVHKNRFVLVFRKVGDAWKLHIDSWTPQ